MKHLDKAHHFFYSLGLAIVASFFVGLVQGVAIAALLGLLKEIYDHYKPNGRFCWWDMTANGIGLGVAVVVMWGWGV